MPDPERLQAPKKEIGAPSALKGRQNSDSNTTAND